MRLTVKTILSVMPHCRHPSVWIRPLEEAMEKYGIKDDSVPVFLAQVAVESAEMNCVDENLNYSPQRLCAVWPKRFPDVAAAIPYSRNPERLGSHVYANRMGNGPESSGDGYRYRGRGLIQITGKDKYKKLDAEFQMDVAGMPDVLLTPKYAALSAAWFWNKKNLDWLAEDLPADDDEQDFVDITKKINGGIHGLAERQTYWERAKAALDNMFLEELE